MEPLRYGENSSVRLHLGASTAFEWLDLPRGEPPADLDAAVRAALHAPLDYPPLTQCATPGDRVVLALDDDVPQAATVVAAVVRELIDAHVDAESITVLQTQANRDSGEGDPRRWIDSAVRRRVALQTHNPSERRDLAYLAADGAGEAILVHRALHEADVILPVGCLRGDGAAGYFGIHGGLYPTYSDARTQHRFRKLSALNHDGGRQRELCALADNVAWLLGATFTVQLVPGAGRGALDVVAGQADTVRRRGRELYQAAWGCSVSRRADLVVATIEGGAARQTWDNFGRALRAAGKFAEDGGAIVLCCELASPPGPAMRQLARDSSRESALRHISKERPADALPAAILARALDRHKVYLLSRLDPELVEELDMAPIVAQDELVRLVAQHSSPILLANAPYAAVEEKSCESSVS